MDLIVDSVKKIEGMLENCGCEEGDVLLEPDPDIVKCQYERGACMVASFGGKTAEFVTDNPIRARTKISFMFDAPLEAPQARSAAGSILNVISGFFSLTRIQHACPAPAHTPCFDCLKKEIEGKRILCIGDMPAIKSGFTNYLVESPEEAEIILFNGDGIIDTSAGDIIEAYSSSKRIICLGPSASGIARLNGIEHFCPYGT
jgi:hypothetical protein